MGGFEAEMTKQRQRSKDSAKVVDLEVGGVLAGLGSQIDATSFSGHASLESRATVVALLRGGRSIDSASAGACCLYFPAPRLRTALRLERRALMPQARTASPDRPENAVGKEFPSCVGRDVPRSRDAAAAECGNLGCFRVSIAVTRRTESGCR